MTQPVLTAPSKVQQDQPRRPIVPMVIVLLLGVAGTGWAVFAGQVGAGAGLEKRLEAHEAVLTSVLSSERDWLATVGRVLAGDARMRSTLGIREIDEGTITDILADVIRGNRIRILATMDDRGRVRAVVGADALRGTDLAEASVVRKAIESRGVAKDVWTLDSGAYNVVVVPVLVGPETNAYLLLGHPIEAELLEAIVHDGTSAAVVVGGGVAQRTKSEGITDEDFIAASSGPVADRFVSRVQTLVQKPIPARVVWLAPKPGPLDGLSGSLQALLVGVLGALVIVVMTNASRKQG